MLGDLELQQVQRLETEGDQLLVAHRVPGLEGDFLQGLGRRGARIALTGVLSGAESRESLKDLREKFRAAEPVPFVSDIATATQVDEVLIEEMEVREIAGKPERFEYAFALREYTPPPAEETEEPPPPPPPPPEPVEETGTLIVEVIVEGEPGFDFSTVTVTAEGTQENGQALSLTLTERANNFWTQEEMPPGQYTVRAVVTDPEEMNGSAEAAVRAGETEQVTITLRRGAVLAKAFIVHFWFDNAFVEPCMKEVLARVAEHADGHPDEKLVIVGHCDKTGSDEYNQSLSERRARAVFAVLTAGRAAAASQAEWNELRQAPPPAGVRDSWGVREYQLMLQDLRYYPGAIDGQHGPMTQAAVRAFQHDRNLPETGAVDGDTWEALIAAYLSRSPLSLAGDRFLSNCPGEPLKWLGMGEQDPVRNTEDAWRPNRRVELLFVRADRLPREQPPPETFALPAPGAVNAGWCVGTEETPRERFLSRGGAAAEGTWPVEPAEPGTVLVRGSIVHEDGTPAAGARYVLIAPDGENMDGEKASGTGRGRPIPGRAAADGTFSYPAKPKGVGIYVLEILEPFAVRNAGTPPAAAKGSLTCKRLDGSSGFDVVLTGRPAVTSRSEVRVFVQDSETAPETPLDRAWVYWREEANPALLRTDETGLLFALRDGADRTLPWEYTNRFTAAVGTPLGLYFSRGARPIPDPVLDERPDLFTPAVVEPAGAPGPEEDFSFAAADDPPGGGTPPGPAQATLPNRLVQLTRPAELSLWPLLWQLPTSAYATQGLNQGGALWTSTTGSGNLTVTEGDPAPAPSATVRPQERGLKIEGTIDARATGATIRILGAAGTPLSLKTSFSAAATAVQQVSATLGTASGNIKPFEAAILFVDAAAALGPVDISVESVGMTPAVLEVFAVHLAGVQIAIVEDASATPAQRGPQLGEADERILVDFLASPQSTLPDLSQQTRARRMIPFDIRSASRLLDPAAAAGPANPSVVKPQMPMWMQELHLVGLSRAQLENLYARKYVRQHGPSPGQRVDLSLDLAWKLDLSWDGPDSGTADGYDHTHSQPATEGVRLHFGHRGQFLDSSNNVVQVDAQGNVPGSLTPAPTAAAFPVSGRRLPNFVVGQQRPWGRQAGAAAKDILLVELQPLVTSGGSEIIRGGDGFLELSSLTIDGTRVHPGLIPGPGGTPQDAPATTADAALPRFRVRGLNPTTAQINTLIDALVEEFFNANSTAPEIGMLTLAQWQVTVRRIVAHESRTVQGQFDRRGNGPQRLRFGSQRFGHEFGMPAFGAPHGYGIAQLDNMSIPPLPAGQTSRRATPDEVWSFLANLRSAVRIVMQEKARIARNAFTTGAGAATFGGLAQDRRRAMFRREVVRRYNGGREFQFEGGQWVIHTSVGADRQEYPDDVLGTNINYPGQRDFPASEFGPGIP